VELLKYASNTIDRIYLNIMDISWMVHQMPEEWKGELIFPIFKKGAGITATIIGALACPV
jgi:hypothetical protein